MNMQPSQTCLDLIKDCEGLHRQLANGSIIAYPDPVGIWTIGYGSIYHPVAQRSVQRGDVITEAEALQWLALEVEEKAKAVNQLCTVPLTQGMFDALVSFTYNVGIEALKESTLLRKLNNKDYEGAAREFDRWVHGDGQVLPGLVIRRDKEEALFRKDGFPGDEIEITPPIVAAEDKPYQRPELPLKIQRTLKLGVTLGEDCYFLNCALAQLGYLQIGNQPNSFTPVTKEAVEWFQSQKNLKVDGIVGPKTKATLSTALAHAALRIGQAIIGRVYCRLRRTHTPAYEGLEWLSLEFVSPQGNILDKLPVVSGAPGKQSFKLPEDRDAGSLEPLPQGRYLIGDMDWAGGKDNYEVAHYHSNNGIGPVFVPLIKSFQDDSDGFGFHVDWNWVKEGHSPGSAGCICPATMDNLKELIRLLRLHDPRDLFVDWELL